MLPPETLWPTVSLPREFQPKSAHGETIRDLRVIRIRIVAPDDSALNGICRRPKRGPEREPF
jgi:hypothetical protein